MRIYVPLRYLVEAHNGLHGWRRLAVRVALFEACVLLGMLITPQIQPWLPRREVHRVSTPEALRQFRMHFGDPRRDPRVGVAAPPLRLQDTSGNPVSMKQLGGQWTALV